VSKTAYSAVFFLLAIQHSLFSGQTEILHIKTVYTRFPQFFLFCTIDKRALHRAKSRQ